jgi:uncharacterized sulfatase
MSKLGKVSLTVVVGLALLASLVWANRADVVLSIFEFAVPRMNPVGTNVAVEWKTGVDPEGRAPAERPPNIVLILADDLGWNDLTFAGGGVAGGTVPTPNIDSLAAEGVNFVNGYAANATCAPSRAALMSGRYGTRFGFEFTPVPPGMSTMLRMMRSQDAPRLRPTIPAENGESPGSMLDLGMPGSELTLAELLKGRGYHTTHIGKWHLGQADGMTPETQGFDESLLMDIGLYLPKDDPNVVNAKQEFDPIDRFLWSALQFAVSFNGGEKFEPAKYLTDYYTEEAAKVIEANKDRPFFLYLAHWAPHTPLQATKEDYEALSHIELHRERVYAAMIRALDRGVGQVLDALRDNGLEENTLVIFTSDNGAAGYIGLPDVNAPYRGWKMTLFEGGIRVPYFIRWPSMIPAGTTVTQPVHHFDLFATAAAASGAALPADRKIDGIDLLPFVNGQTDNEAGGVTHERLFWRSGVSQTALVDGWKLNVSHLRGADSRKWLFDLRADPTEQVDLSEKRPKKLAELEAALEAHNAEQASSMWSSTGSMGINIDKDLSIPDAPDDEYVYWTN